jgi:hypothetical protein
MTEPSPIEAAIDEHVQERPDPPPSERPNSFPLPPNGGTTAGDFSLRTSPLEVKLALLERGHAALATSRNRRRLLMILAFILALGFGAAIGAIAGVGVSELLSESPPPTPRRTSAQVRDEQGRPHYFVEGQEVQYVQYQYYQQTSPPNPPKSNINRQADAIGLLTGLGIGVLFPLLIWFFLIRRIGQFWPDGVNLKEQIDSIVRAHPAEVEAWGGAVVLHNWDLVRELLDLERGARRPPRQGARRK